MTTTELITKHVVIAIDSNVFIYVLEGSPPGQLFRPLVAALERGDIRGVLSSIGLAEILAGPARRRDTRVFEAFATEIRSIPNLRITTIDAEVAADAAWLRGDESVGLSDALQLAGARAAGATAFLTNDRRLHSRPGLQIVQLSDLDVA